MRDSDDELVRVDELLTLAYDTPSRLRELELLQSVQPDGWYVIEDDGAPLAVAGCLVYGAFCWLGLVATHPDARGRGLASQVSSHLVEWAMARGCRTVALDASTLGRPVYERLGFRAAGATAELVRPAGTTPDPGTRAEQATPAAFDEIARFDRKVFGGDRSRLLQGLARDPLGAWWITRGDDGAISGYLLARSRLLGPGAALEADGAERLVRSALDETLELRVLVPAESAFHDALTRLGFVEQRRLAHMRFGDPGLPGERSRLIAQLSYATG
jgi:GNAT superfamily N-acetyltransferase